VPARARPTAARLCPYDVSQLCVLPSCPVCSTHMLLRVCKTQAPANNLPAALCHRAHADGWMGLAGGQPVGILKSNVSQSQWALGVNSVLLLRQDEGQPSSGSSSSGLSAGAIAGIAVGACAAVAAAAAAAWLLVQRRRKARPVGQVDGKAEIETALAVAVEPSLPLHDSSYSVAQHGNLPTERSAAVAAAAASSHSTLTGSSVATAGQAAALPLSHSRNVPSPPHHMAGWGLELDFFAELVIGGISLSGGKGPIMGTVQGALIIGILNNGLVLLNVSPFWQQVIKGLVILLAVIVEKFNSKKE